MLDWQLQRRLAPLTKLRTLVLSGRALLVRGKMIMDLIQTGSMLMSWLRTQHHPMHALLNDAARWVLLSLLLLLLSGGVSSSGRLQL